MSEIMIEANRLTKSFGSHLAVDNVSLQVPRGSILGLLGPNGAGKTTTIRILTTLVRPDTGWAKICGHDVVTDSAAARASIGGTAQDVTVDEMLTGRQNLIMVGRLSGLRRNDAYHATDQMLEQFNLSEVATRQVKTYSGGMRRRLDLAACLVTRPPILFLDEPTTGLDPASRTQMWEVIRSVVRTGTTVLLTTQYLDEADELADQIVVMNNGQVIATGTPTELKAQAGGAQLEVHLTSASDVAISVVRAHAIGEIRISENGTRLRAPVPSQPGLVTALVRSLDEVGITIDDIAVRQPSLDDVFFALTGHPSKPAKHVEQIYS